MNMKNYKSFNYFGWDVDDEDSLYKKLILKNRDMTSEELMIYKSIKKNFLKNNDLGDWTPSQDIMQKM
jgi:hypothetical protein